MTREESLRRVVSELGVDVFQGWAMRAGGLDGLEVTLVLPFETETVKIDAETLLVAAGGARQIIDSLAEGRDRLYARVLAHMARHDSQIAWLLRRDQELAKKRETLIAILDGMSAVTP